MRELMLKLLTYEPFERITGDEKEFIDAVLANNVDLSQQFSMYYDLMIAFRKYDNLGDFDDTTHLVNWFNQYYTIVKVGNIDVLSYKVNGVRTFYPILFKKICVYGLLFSQLTNNTRDGHSNAKFFNAFGMRENILNKWHVSARYLFLANKDTYSAFTIFAKKMTREKRIPFDVSVDPFYSESNMAYLRKVVEDIESGKAVLVEHELIED